MSRPTRHDANNAELFPKVGATVPEVIGQAGLEVSYRVVGSSFAVGLFFFIPWVSIRLVLRKRKV